MILLPIHIIAGLIGLVSGYVALYALKGAKVHRKSGIIFVYSMLVMSGLGAIIAVTVPARLSIIAGILTFYLVTTALLTVRRRAVQYNWVDVVAMLIAFADGLVSVWFGYETWGGELDGKSAGLYVAFGTIAIFAATLDLRMMFAKPLERAHRLARHLWRMCFALFLAAASFFLGKANTHFPEPLRHMTVLVIPVLLVLLLMFFWLGLVLLTRRYRTAPVASRA